MKSSFFHLSAVLLFALTFCVFTGCGSNEEPKNETNSPATESKEAKSENEVVVAKPAELEKAVEDLAAELRKENPELEKAEAPIQMTYYFIRALQMNNQKAMLGMLTQDAYRELSSRETVPCPEFIQSSEVQLGNVQYLSDEKDETKIVGARVGTTWNVKTEEGIIQENIAWVFRFEDDAWLVAGMISVLDPKYPPILINFEDLQETEQQLAELDKEIEKINAEAAKAPQKGTESEEPAVEATETAVEATETTVETVEATEIAPATKNGAENEKIQGTVPSQNLEEPASELPAELPVSL